MLSLCLWKLWSSGRDIRQNRHHLLGSESHHITSNLYIQIIFSSVFPCSAVLDGQQWMVSRILFLKLSNWSVELSSPVVMRSSHQGTSFLTGALLVCKVRLITVHIARFVECPRAHLVAGPLHHLHSVLDVRELVETTLQERSHVSSLLDHVCSVGTLLRLKDESCEWVICQRVKQVKIKTVKF